MPKTKTAEPQVAPAKKAPAKRTVKPKNETKGMKASRRIPAGVRIAAVPFTVGAEKPKKAASKAKPEAKAAPTRKNAKHEAVPDAVVLSALGSGKPSTKAEIVAACGGDEAAVTKTVNKLRGQGKIVVQGSTRSAVYHKAA